MADHLFKGILALINRSDGLLSRSLLPLLRLLLVRGFPC